ncbi:MAG TPA: MipA/OmpV family protein [Rhodocyclaceae bacterium]|nr:MipA/OmpV family protein [Rhodocyclaceae bacterium]
MTRTTSAATLVAGFIGCSAALAGDGYTGDLGLGVYSREGTYRGESTQTDVLPYVYGQWGRVFGRVDTFGVQLLPVAYGHLEVGTRIMQDRMDSDSLKHAGVRARNNSRLLGLSTFQVTPLGAISAWLMQDLGDSEGQIAEISWLGALKPTPWLSIYPELGLEVLSSKYTDYYFGVRAGEGGYAAYRAGTAKNPYAAIHTSSPITGNWNLALTLRYKWLDSEISDSPIVGKSSRWNAYVAVSYDFK